MSDDIGGLDVDCCDIATVNNNKTAVKENLFRNMVGKAEWGSYLPPFPACNIFKNIHKSVSLFVDCLV